MGGAPIRELPAGRLFVLKGRVRHLKDVSDHLPSRRRSSGRAARHVMV